MNDSNILKNSTCLDFWDSEISLHRGYFDNVSSTSISTDEFLTACQRWNEYRLQRSGITNESKVLDISCDDGNTSIWLAQQTGCEVVSVNINNPQNQARNYPKLNISFHKASVTNLPFADCEFTHVWSQGNICQIDEGMTALQEIHRVLKEGGTLILDDLVTPKSEISETTRRHYGQLGFEPKLSPESYRQIFSQLGLMVLSAEDLSQHLHKSYKLLSQLAISEHPELNAAYINVCEAIEKQELGWNFYVCEKVSDRLGWIHQNRDTQELKNKYNAWSKIYEADIGKSWQIMPMNAARLLEELLPDKDINILDAGAGTGMVGEALVEVGYKNITAIDLSEDMLEVAQKKQVYTQLQQVNLEEPITCLDGNVFDAIMAIGVFTYGHASPAGLYHLLPLLKQGGVFILTVRLSNQPMQDAFTKIPWTLISQHEYIFEGAPFNIVAYRKN